MSYYQMTGKQTIGYRGESYAISELSKHGYSAVLRPIFNDRFDATIAHKSGRLPVEIKTAYASRYPRGLLWQFNLENLDRTKDSVVILLAIDGGEKYLFCVPSWLFFDRRKVAITSRPAKYIRRGRGWLARYFERWQTIDEVASAQLRLAGNQQIGLPGLAG